MIKHFLKKTVKELKSWAFKLVLQLCRASLLFQSVLLILMLVNLMITHLKAINDNYDDYCLANNGYATIN